jgi:uncharacterized cupin superfamily protein
MTHQSNKQPAAVYACEVAAAQVQSVLPEPLASRFKGRERRRLGEHFGLANFGVNLTQLKPGGISSFRHAHKTQDEFVYVVEGHPTLHTNGGVQQLAPGMCAGFRAGTDEAHNLSNDTDRDVWYLEIGDRSPGDEATYPDVDLKAVMRGTSWVFTRKNGAPL